MPSLFKFFSKFAILFLNTKQCEAIIFPEIDEDLWIEKTDLDVIDLAISQIINNMEGEMTSIQVTNPPRIGSARISVSSDPAISIARDIRADTSGAVSNITVSLKGFPLYAYQSEYRQLAADLPDLRAALRPVLAHEASHVRQIERGGSKMNDARDAASKANRKAFETKQYADYIAYVGNGIEIAAHATQLAVEVLATASTISTESEFEQAALKTWLLTCP